MRLPWVILATLVVMFGGSEMKSHYDKISAATKAATRKADVKCSSRGMESISIDKFHVCRDRSGRIYFFEALEEMP